MRGFQRCLPATRRSVRLRGEWFLWTGGFDPEMGASRISFSAESTPPSTGSIRTIQGRRGGDVSLLLSVLCLLLVPLLRLLPLSLASVLAIHALVFLLLLLLELLPLLLLFGKQLVLLLLVFPVAIGIAGVRRSRPLKRRKLVGMHWTRTATTGRWISTAFGGRMIGRSGFPGRYDVAAGEFSRAARGGDGWPALIDRRAQLPVRAGLFEMLRLCRYRCNVPPLPPPFLFRRRAPLDAARSAVVTDTIDGDVVVDHRLVVHVVNVDDIDIGHGAVVKEVSAVPASACETHAEIAEAVVDAAIEADMWSPVSFMEEEPAAFPSPPGRGPQETDFRGQNPGSRNPVIIT